MTSAGQTVFQIGCKETKFKKKNVGDLFGGKKFSMKIWSEKFGGVMATAKFLKHSLNKKYVTESNFHVFRNGNLKSYKPNIIKRIRYTRKLQ